MRVTSTKPILSLVISMYYNCFRDFVFEYKTSQLKSDNIMHDENKCKNYTYRLDKNSGTFHELINWRDFRLS